LEAPSGVSSDRRVPVVADDIVVAVALTDGGAADGTVGDADADDSVVAVAGADVDTGADDTNADTGVKGDDAGSSGHDARADTCVISRADGIAADAGGEDVDVTVGIVGSEVAEAATGAVCVTPSDSASFCVPAATDVGVDTDVDVDARDDRRGDGCCADEALSPFGNCRGGECVNGDVLPSTPSPSLTVALRNGDDSGSEAGALSAEDRLRPFLVVRPEGNVNRCACRASDAGPLLSSLLVAIMLAVVSIVGVSALAPS
jgi:hypothetical protein